MGRRLESKENLNLNIPESLISLIMKLYPRSWKFITNKCQEHGCKISEDKKSVNISSKTYISVQFGDFFSRDSRMEYIFSFESGYQHHNGFGFITKEFDVDNQTTDAWNNGHNHSMVYYANGYCARSKEFMLENDEWTEYKKAWYDKKEIVNIKINTERMEALMWNRSKIKIDDLEFNQYDADNQYQHLIQLPKDEQVALIAVLGCTLQKITILSQKFKFLKS